MAEVGANLRDWRKRRRVTQLDLALDAGVSSRHLSFVETGRSKPGRELLLRLLGQLDVPYREQNRLLLAAGHAPAFPERSLADAELAPIREALELILSGHEPYPALAVDRHWNMVAANRPLEALAAQAQIAPELLEPPVNILRVGFHPRGVAPLLVDAGQWHAHFQDRVARQLAATGDRDLAALLDEIEGYAREAGHATTRTSSEVLGPLTVRGPDSTELAFFGMFAGFDTPFEVTASELALELFFPADPATAELLEGLVP